MRFDRNIPRCPICNERLYIIREAKFLITGADVDLKEETIEPFATRFVGALDSSFDYEEEVSCDQGHSEDEMVAALRELEDFDVEYNVTLKVSVRNSVLESAVIEDEGLDQMLRRVLNTDGEQVEYERVSSILEPAVYQPHWPVITLRTGYHEKGLAKYVEDIKERSYNAGRARGLADATQQSDVLEHRGPA